MQQQLGLTRDAPTPASRDALERWKRDSSAREQWAQGLKEGDLVAVVCRDGDVVLRRITWVHEETATLMVWYEIYHRASHLAGFPVDQEAGSRIEPITPDLERAAMFWDLRERVRRAFTEGGAAEALDEGQAIAVAAIIGLELQVSLPEEP